MLQTTRKLNQTEVEGGNGDVEREGGVWGEVLTRTPGVRQGGFQLGVQRKVDGAPVAG